MPEGNDPVAVLHTNAPSPPAAANDCEYTTPTVASGNAAVVIAGTEFGTELEDEELPLELLELDEDDEDEALDDDVLETLDVLELALDIDDTLLDVDREEELTAELLLELGTELTEERDELEELDGGCTTDDIEDEADDVLIEVD